MKTTQRLKQRRMGCESQLTKNNLYTWRVIADNMKKCGHKVEDVENIGDDVKIWFKRGTIRVINYGDVSENRKQ